MSAAARLRARIAARAGRRCEYCLTHEDHSPAATFEVDHIIPKISGGQTTLDNLAYSCPYCNGRKWIAGQAMDPKTEQRVQLFNPRSDHWGTHFRWSRDGTRILGRTAVGRATVERLRFNRLAMRRARRHWLSDGEHPMIR